MKKLFLLAYISCHLLATTYSRAQDFQPIVPLNTKPLLAGNFAELRPNHFHGGLDLKTEGKEGLQVLAAQDGYVSRIIVSPYGYGKMLYITHANGYVTTYGHLQKYAPAIEVYVKKKQYEKQTYDIDITPAETEFVVKKGEWVGVSGNTGGSHGPHLHFEVRDTSNNGWNPLLFAFREIEDTTPPEITGLFAYALGNDAQVAHTQLSQQLQKKRLPDGSFVTDTLRAIGTIGFGFQAFDRQDGTLHKNGIYKATLLLNGEPQLQSAFDKVNFGDTRCINILTDYERYLSDKSFVQLLYKKPGNRLEIYKILKENNGYLTIEEGQTYTATVVIEDFKGNATSVHIPIKGERLELKTERPENKGNKQLIAKRDNYYELSKGSVFFPENTFYEDQLINISEDSDGLLIGNRRTPVDKYFTVTMKNTNFAEDEISKVFISAAGGFATTVYKDGVFTARARNLGRYSLRKDSTPPTLKALNFKDKGVVKGNTLKVTVSDNLSGFASCSATLNGQWILFEYEPKNRTLTFNFDDVDTTDTTKYELNINAYDKVGNVGTLKATFTRPNS
ncbi:M23 family metallopeptidase [Capnocytophaga leadbetteri]|uniref:M23 family metallopeptidase n=1 Tax=Capnocytophaga leadbetteri TaxID=327575 RepID=UPI0028EB8284|nr:M23 family metallopeptidase [Capnocytophaga leadbetteri]